MTKQTTARAAGLVYLFVVLTGIFNLMYVPKQLIVFSDAATTISNITGNELLFRTGVAAGVICYVFFLILPFILFDLFKEVNRNVAVFMVVFAASSVPISLFNMVTKLDILSLLSGAEYLNTFSAEQIEAKVMLLLHSYNNGIRVVQIFWGLWLFPFGYLAYKSGYIPKILGISLMLGCFGYLIYFFARIVFPEASIPSFIGWPASFGEIGTCLWLLIMGVKNKSLKA